MVEVGDGLLPPTGRGTVNSTRIRPTEFFARVLAYNVRRSCLGLWAVWAVGVLRDEKDGADTLACRCASRFA